MKTYRIKRSTKILMGILSPLLIALFIFVGLLPFSWETPNTFFSIFFILAGFGAGGFFLWGFIEICKAELILNSDSIQLKSWFTNKTIKIDDVKGFRIHPGYYIRIESRNKNEKHIDIQQHFQDFIEIQDWVRKNEFVNLDEREFVKAQKELENQNFENLKQLHTLTKALNGIAVASTLWIFVFPRPYEVSIITAVVCFISAIILMWLNKGAIRFDQRKNDPHPSLVGVFTTIPFGIALRSFLDWKIVNWSSIWIPVIITACVLTFIIYKLSSEFDGKKKWMLLLVFFFMFAFSFGFIMQVNCLFDYSKSNVHKSEILEKQISTGKRTTYYLIIAAWGPHSESQKISVTQNKYDAVTEDDFIFIKEKKGILNIPWYYVSLN